MRQGQRSAYLDNLYDDFGLAVELDGPGAHPADARWREMAEWRDLPNLPRDKVWATARRRAAAGPAGERPAGERRPAPRASCD